MSLTYSNRTTFRNEVVSKENMHPFFTRVREVINETTLVLVDLLLCLGAEVTLLGRSHGSTFVPLCKLKAQRKPMFAFGCSVTLNLLIYLITCPSHSKDGAAFEKLEFRMAVGHIQVKHSNL